MEMKKKKQQIEKVSKPFMKGDIVDQATAMSAVKFFGGTVAMSVAFLFIGVMMNWDMQWLNVTVNVFLVLAIYMFFYQIGMNTGSDAVNQGEIMLSRQEKGRPVASWEKSLCYHPLKGFVSGLIGSVPILVCSIILAIVAKRQMTTLGALPSWIAGLETRPEIGNAIAYYHETVGMDLEAVMRLVVRMTTMPFVNIVGASNKDGMLLLERISPLLNLFPAIAYGLGYMGGTTVRTSVHTNIALGKKKAKRKQAKERRARRQTHRGPEQLN